MMVDHRYFVFEPYEPQQVWRWLESGRGMIWDEDLPILIHRPRLDVYRLKGCGCVACGRVGNRFHAEIQIGSKDLIAWFFDPQHKAFPLTHLNLYGVEDGRIFMMTADHIKPRSLGGSDEIENLAPMCERCNKLKGNDPDWQNDLPRAPDGGLMKRRNRQRDGLPGVKRKRGVFYA